MLKIPTTLLINRHFILVCNFVLNIYFFISNIVWNILTEFDYKHFLTPLVRNISANNIYLSFLYNSEVDNSLK